ncbi:MAG: polysaccharide deacetylase family protein [Burkholderiales bacterium]
MTFSWSPFRWLSPPGSHAKLNIFIFHRVLPAPDPILPSEPDAGRFEAMLRFLKQWFNVLPLLEAVKRLEAGTLPAASACITFDDGYADNLTIAAPLLRRYEIPATVFIATGYISGGRMWNDTIIEAIRRSPRERLDLMDLGLPDLTLGDVASRRVAIDRLLRQIKYVPLARRTEIADEVGRRSRADLPDDLMLTRRQLIELSSPLITIGGHTVHHPILAIESAATAEREIRQGRADLEDWIQQPVETFAYPNGRPVKDYGSEHVDLVRRAGFRCAVSTAAGYATEGADVYQLPRFTPWGQAMTKFALQLGRHLVRSHGPITAGAML